MGSNLHNISAPYAVLLTRDLTMILGLSVQQTLGSRKCYAPSALVSRLQRMSFSVYPNLLAAFFFLSKKSYIVSLVFVAISTSVCANVCAHL